MRTPAPGRRHHDTLNAPTNLQSLYFTFQFYHFPPTTSEMAFLVQVSAAPRPSSPRSTSPQVRGSAILHPVFWDQRGFMSTACFRLEPDPR